MNLSPEYIIVLINSTIRMTAPILLVTLSAALCSKVNLLHIGLEGAMIAGAFFSIVVNYFTGNVFLSIMAGAMAGVIVSGLIAVSVVTFKANAVVAGLAANTLVIATTTYLLYLIFNTRGIFTSPELVGMAKINLPLIKDIPFVGGIMANLTILDYFAFIAPFIIFIFLYKTVLGFRVRAVGVNIEAARSLGTPVERYQILTMTLSGALSGMGGVLLSMGAVTLFIQEITAGRGFIALAANTLGQSHPIGVLLSTAFFGATQALGNALQNTAIKGQITASIPYASTILALIGLYVYKDWRKKSANRKAEREEKRGD
jgi:general nucleoside transport system permease protein